MKMKIRIEVKNIDRIIDLGRGKKKEEKT